MSTSKTWLMLSVALFLACLPYEAFSFTGASEPSLLILLMGWLVLTLSPANMTWLANPLLICAWMAVLFDLRTLALCLGFSALALAASFLLMQTVATFSGGTAAITGVGLGYWLWLASAACGFGADLAAYNQKGREHAD